MASRGDLITGAVVDALSLIRNGVMEVIPGTSENRIAGEWLHKKVFRPLAAALQSDAPPNAQQMVREAAVTNSTIATVVRFITEDLDPTPDELYLAMRQAAAGAGVSTDAETGKVVDAAGTALADGEYDSSRFEGIDENGNRGDPIGWPYEGYKAPSRSLGSMNPRSTYGGYRFDSRTGKLVKDETGPQGGQYYPGDEWEHEGRPVEWITSMQANLKKAGLLGSGYRAGAWDDTTAAAYNGLLGVANRQGMRWEDALADQIQRANTPEALAARKAALRAQAAPLAVDAYVAPDPASLAQDVKDYVRRRLPGHELSSGVLRFLSDELAREDRVAYGRNVEISREQYDRQVEGQVAAAIGEGGGVVAPTAEFEEVDPEARFREMFDRRFAGEIATRDTSQKVAVAGGNLMGALDRVRGTIGGNP